MTDQTLDPTTTKYHAGDIVRTSAEFVAIVDHGDWEKGIYRLSSGSAKWKAADLTLIATTHTFPIFLFVALCKAFDAQDKDLNGQTLETKPGAGWRPHHQVGGAKNADRLVDLGFFEIDAAGKSKSKPVVDAEGPRYRITRLGREVYYAMKHKEAKAEVINPDAHIATLTSPELTPDEARKAQIIADVMGFDDEDEDESPPDFTPTPMEETIAEIEIIIDDAIGKQIETDSQGTVDNVRALADFYKEAIGDLLDVAAELNRKQMRIEQLERQLSAAQHTLPPLTEADTLRQQNKVLQAANEALTAQLRAAGRVSAPPQTAAPTTPEIEVMYFEEAVHTPDYRKGAAANLAELINAGWEIKYERIHESQIDRCTYHVARLERNKSAQPEQPLRAAAEVPIPDSAPVGVLVTPVVIPSGSITIRQPAPVGEPAVNSLSVYGEGRGGVDFDTALDDLAAGRITPAQFAVISDRRAAHTGLRAYAKAVQS